MACFDVYRNESSRTAKRFPYFLSVQSALLDNFETCVVVPLGRAAVVEGKPAQTLTPALLVDGETYVMYTPELGAVPAGILRRRVANLDDQRDAIVRALDFLFGGI